MSLDSASVSASQTETAPSDPHNDVRPTTEARWAIVGWLGILGILCLWTAHRLGAFDLVRTVTSASGTVQQANIFSSIDNPFHAARASLLLETLRHGEFLRWIGNHQGGYPAEFYPLGVAWIEVGIWATSLGTLSILAAHKLAVIVIFLLPVVGFWVLARTDRLTPGIAVLALAGQIAIPGGVGLQYWTSGGYTELVLWGLVTNVAGATLALIGFAFLTRVVLVGGRWAMLGAIAALTISTYANPRSMVGVLVGGVAILVGVAWMRRECWQQAIFRMAIVGAITVLLCMPILLSLLRYNDLYIFLHYQSYENLRDYLTVSARTVSPPILVLAALGVLVALLDRRYPAARITALALVGYVLMTAFLSANQSVVAQLETPRLMPFQRFLTLYLASWAVWWMADFVWSHLAPSGDGSSRGRQWGTDGILIGIGGVMLVACLMPWSVVPALYRGLPPVPTTGNAAYADFSQAIANADDLTNDGQAMLVLGTVAGQPLDLGGTVIPWDWHGQLFAPVETDAPLYYNDWLWDWHSGHAGTPGYDFNVGHNYPDPANALALTYLQEHGIGTVVVTNVATQQPNPDPREAARTSPDLTFVQTIGAWDIYAVKQAAPLVTNGGVAPMQISVSDGRIEATFAGGTGDIVIRQNWFPRWKATVNGEAVSVERGSGDTMIVKAPSGDVTLTLVYTVTIWDWIARIAAVLGGVAGVALVILRWWTPWPGLRRLIDGQGRAI